ncbi:hypothetical protein B0T26DRAFT_700111 [Lasiosphaeria miniovina]|uniref:Uncharacterized protein n=1 Tax=Lasiosphaeria miniovina TaxID=1954250 RepID=A0AA40E1Q4_9PEZI|nr:uncharacterized protein B0T26DRAFT_700111 [Lasiosphaeria miniovina]KAK0721717.1 hypothetical protein B0T26DRAFT_700111 [Lasiosphaeria miniovina]
MKHYVSDQSPHSPCSPDGTYAGWFTVRFIYSCSYLILTCVVGAQIQESREKRRFLGIMMVSQPGYLLFLLLHLLLSRPPGRSTHVSR